ncbi:MAG TPA: YhjD/YihY/BrkB family envelope integrity protein [Solirubrobacterales bacterium]|nr:YhjD/YihY/BrkB family envelope integrity protein [Solirubrobacterales bacterium]
MSSVGAGSPARPATEERARRWPRYLRAFWDRAYRENITGMAAMVAFNLLLALFPFALLVLFVFGQVLQSPNVEASVLSDLQQLFPDAEQDNLARLLDRVRDNSTTIGIAAAVGGIWIGASFWGAMDTAFCRIYHVECRGWMAQKRFALVMLLVVVLFLAASVILPTLEGILISGTEDLPFGLSSIDFLDNLLLLVATLVIGFALACIVYWAVPKGHLPWRGVWPGALFLTIVTGVANWAFPFYLVNVSSIGEFGGTVGFILVALIWFYALSLALMAGAVINALRFELHDTGTLDARVDPEGAASGYP